MANENTADDPLPKEVREKLEAEHGEIITITPTVGGAGKVFAFRLPNRTESKRYRQKAQKPGNDAGDEMENLLVSCCIYPDPASLTAFFDRYPMALGSFGIRFQQGAGLDFEALAVVK